MANNKIVYNGTTLIDLTEDDVKESDVRSGIAFHLPNGEQTEGTLEVGDDMKILEMTATKPSGPGDTQTATVTGYEYIEDVFEAMPNVMIIWTKSSDEYYVFSPVFYMIEDVVCNFQCNYDGTLYTAFFDPGNEEWQLDILDPTSGLPYETWEFEVDDGNGGTTLVYKEVYCKDVT